MPWLDVDPNVNLISGQGGTLMPYDGFEFSLGEPIGFVTRPTRSREEWIMFDDFKKRLYLLSPTENRVLYALGQTIRVEQIAKNLKLSVGSVKAATQRIYEKLGVTERPINRLIVARFVWELKKEQGI